MIAQRIVCPEPGRVELEDVPLASPRSDEVLVETEVTLISPGTERAWFLQEEGTPVRFPYQPGYCHVGRVRAAGEAVKRLREGDRVLSQAPHVSAVVLREASAVRIPEAVTSEAAAFVPLGAISLQGVRKARIELGSSVAVLGAGLIGLLAIKFARLSGAYPLIACDLSAQRRDVAVRIGAQRAAPVDELVTVSRELERKGAVDPGFDVVIDATGHPSALASAIAASGDQGVIVLLGSTRGKANEVDVYEIHRKGVHIVGAHNRNRPRDVSYSGMWTSRDDSELILRLLRDNVLSVVELITDRVSPSAVPEVFERMRLRDESMLGCVIEW